MAVMRPEKLPLHITRNSLRAAECRVYQRLEEVLEDPFIVFYSRPWLGEKSTGEEIDGECDFVVAHPELGFLALEVKGGAVRYIPEHDRWTSKDRHGIIHNIKNPVGQARTSKHQILEKLKKSALWSPRRIRARHGIIFPDCAETGGNLAADIPRDLVCYLEDIEGDFRSWIVNRLGSVDSPASHEFPLGEDGIKALDDLLAHPFYLHVSLGKMLADEEMEIRILTQQQYQILTAIEAIPKAAISGGAGTGKTILAMEEAKRCADAGMRVLLTCFNKPLAMHIRRQLEQEKGIRVATFHELCYHTAADADIRIPNATDSDQLYDKVYPEILIKSLTALPDVRFDVIIVDEGQDFRKNWWHALEMALDPSGKKLMRVFYDSNQAVYGNTISLLSEFAMVPIHLRHNMRNSRPVYQLAQKYYSGYPIDSVGPEGTEPEWYSCNSFREIQRKLFSEISRLIVEEKVMPGNIAVLVSSEKILSQFTRGGKLGTISYHSCSDHFDDTIILDTMRRFKGLESPVLFLIITSDIVTDNEVIYVALSRARSKLILIGDQTSLDWIKNFRKREMMEN